MENEIYGNHSLFLINPKKHYMEENPQFLLNTLKKRESELKNLMDQMRRDKMDHSRVFKSIEEELDQIQVKMIPVPENNPLSKS